MDDYIVECEPTGTRIGSQDMICNAEKTFNNCLPIYILLNFSFLNEVDLLLLFNIKIFIIGINVFAW